MFKKLAIAALLAASFPVLAQTLIVPKIATPTSAVSSGVNITHPIIIAPNVQLSQFGTYDKLFSAQSLWNSKPVAPVLDLTVGIQPSTYQPTIAAGGYSIGVFQSKVTDPTVTVYPPTGTQGISDPDSAGYRASITISHWPANVQAAIQDDGHADITDESTGIIHSFWQLKNTAGKWTAALYSWSPISSTGWGTPSHYYQGARATGVVPSAGIIRKFEVSDGASSYSHVLAISLTYNSLSASPTYIFPATSADGDAAWMNSGKIPEGTLLMLPANFDTSKMTPAIKKVAETLKIMGARVVDRNVGTPYAIYVEIGSAWNLMPNGWDNAINDQLVSIQKNLHPLKSSNGFTDANGVAFTPSLNVNNISMRGPWTLQSTGTASGTFDTWTQQLNFPPTSKQIVQYTVGGPSSVTWAARVPGASQKLSVKATGGATINFAIYGGGSVVHSVTLGDGQSDVFPWPVSGWMVMQAISGVSANTGSSVVATMTNN